jgi:hypothetical protein
MTMKAKRKKKRNLKEWNPSSMRELVASGKGCLVVDRNSYYTDFVFNQHSYLLDEIKRHPEKYTPVVYKKWRKGFAWKRTYDENWTDHRTEQHYTADPEPKFEQLREYLEAGGIDYRSLTIGEIEDFDDMMEEEDYCSDRYYGSDVYIIKYIPCTKLDEWIANKIRG